MNNMKIKKKMLYPFIGNIFLAFSQWFIVWVIARNYEVEVLGAFSYCLAISLPIIMFTSFQMRNVYITDANEDITFNRYFKFRIYSSLFSFLLVLGISFLFGFDWNILLLLILVMSIQSLESIADLTYGVHQKNNTMKYIAISQGIRVVILLGSFLSVIFFEISIYSFLSIILLFNIIRFFIWDLNSIKDVVNFKFNLCKKFSFKKILILSFPLGVVSLLTSLSSNIPRYYLEVYTDLADLGVFTAVFQLSSIGLILVNSLSQLYIPKLSILFSTNKIRGFLKYSLILSFITLIFSVSSVVIVYYYGEDLIIWIYGEDFLGTGRIFFLIMLATAVGYLSTILGSITTATRRFDKQYIYTLASLIITVFLGMYLVKNYGLVGAPLTILIAHLIKIGINFYILSKIIKKG